jgi:hypothetical protein
MFSKHLHEVFLVSASSGEKGSPYPSEEAISFFSKLFSLRAYATTLGTPILLRSMLLGTEHPEYVLIKNPE